MIKKSLFTEEYQAPEMSVVLTEEAGVICASGTNEGFTQDEPLVW